MTSNELPFDTAHDRLDEILDLFDVPDEVEHTADVLAEVVSDPEVSWSSGNSPNAVATACLYVADYAVRQDDRLSQRQLIQKAPTTHTTMRKMYRQIPRVFLEHATEEQRSRLDDNVVEVLCVFRYAEEVGLGIADLDPWLCPKDSLDE